MINRLSSMFNKIFTNIQKEGSQKKLKNINIILSFVSLFILSRIIIEVQIEQKYFRPTINEVLVCLAYYMSNSLLWISFMKRNYPGSSADYFYNWSLSKIGKYIPGGLMILTVRLNQPIKNNSNSKKIFFGIVEEHFLAPLISIFSIVLCLTINLEKNNLILFILSTVVSFFMFKYFYFKLERNYESLINFKFLYLLHLNLNFLFFYVVAQTLDTQEPFKLTLLYLLSSCIGLIFIGVPAGLGIRELIFYWVTSGIIPEMDSINLMIKIRIMLIAFDLFFGLLGMVKLYLYDTFLFSKKKD